MDKKEIQLFFDEHAATWDAEMVKDDGIISLILDKAHVRPGARVLDVACGTGVLINYYLQRNVAEVVGIDLSQEMIRIASSKFNQPDVRFRCMDVEDLSESEKFDCIVIYNAFPHFVDGEKIIALLSQRLERGGTLTVAHGMGRTQINAHHEGCAKHISQGHLEEDVLAGIMGKYLEVQTVSHSDQYYIVSGNTQ